MHAGRSEWLTKMITGAGLATMLGTAYAATPAQNCRSAKNKAVGKYADCRQNAEAKFALTGDGAKLAEDIAKCTTKFQEKWPAIEAKANGACPSVGDQAAVQGVLNAQAINLATALAGAPLQNCPADLSMCQTDLAMCQASGGGMLLKTGQTLCYDVTGVVIPCAGTGQDGEFQKGLARSLHRQRQRHDHGQQHRPDVGEAVRRG